MFKGMKKVAPDDSHRSRASGALTHLGPDIPWQVASPQSLPPFLRATRTVAWTRPSCLKRNNQPEEQV